MIGMNGMPLRVPGRPTTVAPTPVPPVAGMPRVPGMQRGGQPRRRYQGIGEKRGGTVAGMPKMPMGGGQV